MILISLCSLTVGDLTALEGWSSLTLYVDSSFTVRDSSRIGEGTAQTKRVPRGIHKRTGPTQCFGPVEAFYFL